MLSHWIMNIIYGNAITNHPLIWLISPVISAVGLCTRDVRIISPLSHFIVPLHSPSSPRYSRWGGDDTNYTHQKASHSCPLHSCNPSSVAMKNTDMYILSLLLFLLSKYSQQQFYSHSLFWFSEIAFCLIASLISTHRHLSGIDRVFPLQYYRVQYIPDDSAWIDLRGDNFTSLDVKSEILSKQYISFAVCLQGEMPRFLLSVKQLSSMHCFLSLTWFGRAAEIRGFGGISSGWMWMIGKSGDF